MLITGYLAFIIAGILMGLLGGGGSILGVPVLVYLFGVPAEEATAYSLFIVGMSSAIASVSYLKEGWVDFGTILRFGLPSMLTVSLMRGKILPMIPEIIIEIEDLELKKNLLIMIVFAVVMLGASYSMIKKKLVEVPHPSSFGLIIQGLAVGAVTGFVGAGGGFLIIPALSLKAGLPIQRAVGTSLVLIVLNSVLGFLQADSETTAIDYALLVRISSFAILGVMGGIYLSRKICPSKLKPIFGWFVLLTGIFILIKEIFL